MRKKYKGLTHLLILLVIVPLFAWKWGVGGTLNRWRENRALQSQIKLLERIDNAPKAATALYGDLLNNGDLLKVISPYVEANGLSVDLYVPYLTETKGSATLRSAQIVLRGGFFPLLKAIDALEYEIPQVSLRSVEFVSYNNLREREMQLRATLIVQQITHRQ